MLTRCALTLTLLAAVAGAAVLPQKHTPPPVPGRVAGCACAVGCLCGCDGGGPCSCDCGCLGEVSLEPPTPFNPYAHLPSYEFCTETLQYLAEWGWALRSGLQAVRVDGGGFLRGCDDFAAQLQQEIELVKWYEERWRALSWVTWPHASDGQKMEWANKLADLIGPFAYDAGDVPGPLARPQLK